MVQIADLLHLFGIERTKVRGSISHVLYQKQIKYLKKQSLWPSEFLNVEDKEKEAKASSSSFSKEGDDGKSIVYATRNAFDSNEEEDKESDVEEDGFYQTNPNHCAAEDTSSEEEDSDED